MDLKDWIKMRLRKYLSRPLKHNDQHLAYFHENKIKINKIVYLGEGLSSKTYKITTAIGDFALNIRTDTIGDYARLIHQNYDYLPKVYDVRKINEKFCVLMEVLQPLPVNEKRVIISMDYLFFATNEGGLDIWIQGNLQEDLYLKIKEIMENTDIDSIPDHKDAPGFKWFCREYQTYELFISKIMAAFREYNKVLGFHYDDFNDENTMQDKTGQLKLIDL